jgi:hypothetical protein
VLYRPLRKIVFKHTKKIRYLRVKISFVVKRIATDVLLFFTEFCLYNKQKNTWVLGNTRFISRVEHDISLVRCAHSWDIMFNTRNKSGISAHPCIILYLSQTIFTTQTGKLTSRLVVVHLCPAVPIHANTTAGTTRLRSASSITRNINITQILHLSNFSELKRLVYIHLQA